MTTADLNQLAERAARREEIRAKLPESLAIAWLVVEEDGRIFDLNKQAELLFGYESTELIGKMVEDLVPEAKRGVHVPHREGYWEEPHTRTMGAGMLLSARRKDGSSFPAAISLGPIAAKGGRVVAVTVVRLELRKPETISNRVTQNPSKEGRA
jgi:PAS domain S-box-containing protein